MNVIKCLNDTKSRSLNCLTIFNYLTECTCSKKTYVDNFSFQINNTDLYANVNIDELANENITDIWNDVTAERVNDCLNRNDTFQWKCATRSTNWDLTRCNCIFYSQHHDTQGFIDTKLLFKGLDNFTIPVHDEAEHSQIHKENCHDNHCDTGNEFNKQKQNGNYSSNVYAFVPVFLSIYFISVYICWIFRNQIWSVCTYKKNEDDTIPLILVEELEIQ